MKSGQSNSLYQIDTRQYWHGKNISTTLYVDNTGALLLASSGQPTKRARHTEVKHVVIQHWVEKDILSLKRIGANNKKSDSMAKK